MREYVSIFLCVCVCVCVYARVRLRVFVRIWVRERVGIPQWYMGTSAAEFPERASYATQSYGGKIWILGGETKATPQVEGFFCFFCSPFLPTLCILRFYFILIIASWLLQPREKT